MPRAPSAFPFSGRLRFQAINPTPPKRVKACEDGVLRPEVFYPVMEHTRTASWWPEVFYPVMEHTRTNRAALPIESASPLDTISTAQGLFKVGQDLGTQPRLTRQSPKIPLATSAPPNDGASEARKQATNNWWTLFPRLFFPNLFSVQFIYSPSHHRTNMTDTRPFLKWLQTQLEKKAAELYL